MLKMMWLGSWETWISEQSVKFLYRELSSYSGCALWRFWVNFLHTPRRLWCCGCGGLTVTCRTQVGYYLQRELETTPYPLNMADYQLDRELIREINNQNGYRFTGTAVDYQQENDYNDVTYRIPWWRSFLPDLSEYCSFGELHKHDKT